MSAKKHMSLGWHGKTQGSKELIKVTFRPTSNARMIYVLSLFVASSRGMCIHVTTNNQCIPRHAPWALVWFTLICCIPLLAYLRTCGTGRVGCRKTKKYEGVNHPRSLRPSITATLSLAMGCRLRSVAAKPTKGCAQQSCNRNTTLLQSKSFLLPPKYMQGGGEETRQAAIQF